jgi:hypothetical protein
MAMAVASATTRFSLYTSIMYAPSAGLITMLAANVADTCKTLDSNYKQHTKSQNSEADEEGGV